MEAFFQTFSRELFAALIPIIITFFKTIRFIHEGELGIRLRFGKAVRNSKGVPKVIHPGLVFMIPFADTLQRHHVRQQTVRLSDQNIMIQQGLIFTVSAVVMFRVTDIYKALFEIDDLERSIRDLAMGLLRDELAHKKYTELSDISSISDGLMKRIKEKAAEWGVEFIQFKLIDSAPTSETAPLINIAAAVDLKMLALQAAAKNMNTEFHQLDPALVATLIGIPVVTTINPPSRTKTIELTQKSRHSQGVLGRILDGKDISTD